VEHLFSSKSGQAGPFSIEEFFCQPTTVSLIRCFIHPFTQKSLRVDSGIEGGGPEINDALGTSRSTNLFHGISSGR